MLFAIDGSLNHFYWPPRWRPPPFIFDVLDGRIARWRQQHSALGRELDSLADIISFGVAPATPGVRRGMRGAWDWVALIYFVCCGVSPAGRYNVTAESLSEGADKVRYFEGTPIPTSVMLTGIPRAGRMAGPHRRANSSAGSGWWGRGHCTRWPCCSCCPAA